MPHIMQVLYQLALWPFTRIAKRYGLLYDRWQQEQLAFRLDAEEIGLCMPYESERLREQRKIERFP